MRVIFQFFFFLLSFILTQQQLGISIEAQGKKVGTLISFTRRAPTSTKGTNLDPVGGSDHVPAFIDLKFSCPPDHVVNLPDKPVDAQPTRDSSEVLSDKPVDAQPIEDSFEVPTPTQDSSEVPTPSSTKTKAELCKNCPGNGCIRNGCKKSGSSFAQAEASEYTDVLKIVSHDVMSKANSEAKRLELNWDDYNSMTDGDANDVDIYCLQKLSPSYWSGFKTKFENCSPSGLMFEGEGIAFTDITKRSESKEKIKLRSDIHKSIWLIDDYFNFNESRKNEEEEEKDVKKGKGGAIMQQFEMEASDLCKKESGKSDTKTEEMSHGMLQIWNVRFPYVNNEDPIQQDMKSKMFTSFIYSISNELAIGGSKRNPTQFLKSGTKNHSYILVTGNFNMDSVALKKDLLDGLESEIKNRLVGTFREVEEFYDVSIVPTEMSKESDHENDTLDHTFLIAIVPKKAADPKLEKSQPDVEQSFLEEDVVEEI